MERYRIVEGVGLYYVTFTVVEWLPVFIDEAACQIVTHSFHFCITNKHLRVNAYVIIPTHLHAITFDSMLWMTCESSPDGDYLTTQHGIFQGRLRSGLRKMQARIESAGFGSHHNIQWGFFQITFGGKRGIIFTIIRAARDWFFILKTGDFLQLVFG